MSKRKFKEGDSVRLVFAGATYYGHYRGDIGIIREVNPASESIYVYVEGRTSTSAIYPNVAYKYHEVELVMSDNQPEIINNYEIY